MPLPQNDRDRSKASLAVVCVGNWLISYDRIGPKVLALSEGRYGPDVALFDAGSAGLALLDCIDGQGLMMVVDACKTGGRTGEIHVTETDFEAEISPGPGLHQIGPMETLAVARQLFPEKLPHRLLFVLVETDGMNDAQLDKAGHRVVSIIEGEIAQFRANRLAVGQTEQVEV